MTEPALPDTAPRKRPKPGERRIQILQALAGMLEQPGAERVTTSALAARLDVSEAALYRHFADRTQLGFGIGTSLSNDLGLTPLNIVMKLTHCNGQPVAKLSDSPGKTLSEDQTFLAYLRQVFNVTAQTSA